MFVILATMFASCDKAQVEPQNPAAANGFRTETPPDKNTKVRYNGEYLMFETPTAFDAFLEALPTKSRKQLDAWEASLGFRSLRNYYETAIDENEKYYEWLRNNMNESLAREIKLNGRPHSAFVKQNAKLLLDENKNLAIKLYDQRLAAVVNTDGIVAVGGYIFQYTENQLKVMPIKHKNKLQTLKNAHSDDKTNGIVVKTIEKATKSTFNGGRTEAITFGNWVEGEWVFFHDNGLTVRYRRVRGSVNLFTVDTPIYADEPINICEEDGSGGYFCYSAPQIIGWTTHHHLAVHAQQWEYTQEKIFGIHWESEARTTELRIDADLPPFTLTSGPGLNFQTSNGDDVANIYFNRSNAYVQNAAGTVTLTGHGGSNTTAFIQ